MAFGGLITGSRELHARLRAIGELQPTLTRVGLISVAEAKRLVPRRTANLGRTIRIGSVSANHVDVVAGGRRNVGYAANVEFGTRAHTIVPKRKKALSFASQRLVNERFGPQRSIFTLGGRVRASATRKFGNAAYVVTKRVHHPGTRAKPYLLPGLREGIRSVTGLIIDAWNRGA